MDNKSKELLKNWVDSLAVEEIECLKTFVDSVEKNH